MKNMKELGFSKYSITKDGEVYSYRVNRFLKHAVNKGYKFYSLTNDDGEIKNTFSHRLVALTYLPNPDNLPQVNHIDGDKLNSSLSNLEWCTPSQNNLHANATGLRRKPFIADNGIMPDPSEIIHDWREQGCVDLSFDDVHKVCQMITDGYRVCDIAGMTGFDRKTVQSIKSDERVKWKHIVSEYDFSNACRKILTSPETVIQICKYLESGKGVNEISVMLSCSRKLVSSIKNKHSYTSISCCYKF